MTGKQVLLLPETDQDPGPDDDVPDLHIAVLCFIHANREKIRYSQRQIFLRFYDPR